MNGWDVLSLLIVCCTVLSGIAIISYAVCFVLTNETVIKAIKETIRENVIDFPKVG